MLPKRRSIYVLLFVLVLAIQSTLVPTTAFAASEYDDVISSPSWLRLSYPGYADMDVTTTYMGYIMGSITDGVAYNDCDATCKTIINDSLDHGDWSVNQVYSNYPSDNYLVQAYFCDQKLTSTSFSTNHYGSTTEKVVYASTSVSAECVTVVVKFQSVTYGGHIFVAANTSSGVTTNVITVADKWTNASGTVLSSRAYVYTGAFTPLEGYTGEFPQAVEPPVAYVAMGDSFSSGEGNQPFEVGSDTSSDKCHRSSQAYPRLIGQDPDLHIGRMDFVACSGAMTGDLFDQPTGADPDGNWGEPPQLSALSEATQVVTITIGGNDIGFAKYAETCAASACGPGTIWYQDIVGAINSTDFTARLEAAYNAILSSAENAQVYVIDYPYITASDATWCGAMDFSGARSVQSLLNSTISLVVNSIGDPRLHYVNTNDSGSPFYNKHLCNGGISDFNGFTLPKEYSFHPNQQGQEDYAAVVKTAMS